MPEHSPRPTAAPTRRRFLAGAASAVAAIGVSAGCRPLLKQRSKPAPPDPDIAITVRALDRTDELLAAYDAVAGDREPLAAALRPFRKRHAAHRTELRARLPKGHRAKRQRAKRPSSATPSASRTAAASTLADLRRLERHAATALVDDALDAGRTLAQVLASMSACAAAHAQLLREVDQ